MSNIESHLFNFTTEHEQGELSVRMGFLRDENDMLRATITGRLTDNKGRMLAVGDIHDIILSSNFVKSMRVVVDFIIIHGSTGTQEEINYKHNMPSFVQMSWHRAMEQFVSLTNQVNLKF